MIRNLGQAQLEDLIEQMLQRPRSLKSQTMRHLDEHVESRESGLGDFLLQAALELEDYQL
jgi:hypothetical protein